MEPDDAAVAGSMRSMTAAAMTAVAEHVAPPAGPGFGAEDDSPPYRGCPR